MLFKKQHHRKNYSSMKKADEGISFVQNEKTYKRKFVGRTMLLPSSWQRQRQQHQDQQLHGSPATTCSLMTEDGSPPPKKGANICKDMKHNIMRSKFIFDRTPKGAFPSFHTPPSSPMAMNNGSVGKNSSKPWKSRLHRCLKFIWKRGPDALVKRDNTLLESDDGDHHMHTITPSLSLSSSTTSAFTPVVKSESFFQSDKHPSSSYPQKGRRHIPSQVALYPDTTVKVKKIPTHTPPQANNNSTFLAVSFSEEFAQLVVPSESGEENSCLGVSFSHPAMSPSDGREGCLGVAQCFQPSFLQRNPRHVPFKPLDDNDKVSTPEKYNSTATGRAISSPPAGCIMSSSPSDGNTSSPENIELSAIWSNRFKQAVSSLIDEIIVCGPMKADDISTASSIVSNVPSDELAIDEARRHIPFDELVIKNKKKPERKGIDPRMMMLSQLSESSSIGKGYLDEDSLSI